MLLVTAFLVGITGWLVGHVRSDRLMAFDLEEAEALEQVAGAAVEVAALSLADLPDWTAVDSLSAPLACPATTMPVLDVDEPRERAWIQNATATGSRWGTDTPTWHPLWRCHAPGVLGRWPAPGAAPGVIVWVADDPEGDGSPGTSVNGRLLLRAVARGRGWARGTAAVTVARDVAGSPVRLVAWRPGTAE